MTDHSPTDGPQKTKHAYEPECRHCGEGPGFEGHGSQTDEEAAREYAAQFFDAEYDWGPMSDQVGYLAMRARDWLAGLSAGRAEGRGRAGLLRESEATVALPPGLPDVCGECGYDGAEFGTPWDGAPPACAGCSEPYLAALTDTEAE